MSAPCRRPVFVKIFGQQVAGIEFERALNGFGRIACEGFCRALLESLQVNPKLARRPQHHLLILRKNKARVSAGARFRFQRAAGEVNGFVQIVAGRIGVEFWPQKLDDLLTVKLMIKLAVDYLFSSPSFVSSVRERLQTQSRRAG